MYEIGIPGGGCDPVCVLPALPSFGRYVAREDSVGARVLGPGLELAPGIVGIAEPARLPDLVARSVGYDIGIPVRRPAPFRERAMLQAAEPRIHAVLLDVVPAMHKHLRDVRVAA